VRRERIGETPLTRPGFGALEDPSKPLESAIRPEAARFDTVLHPPDVTAWALAALDVFDEHGVDDLQARAREGAAGLAGRLEELGLELAPRGESTLVSWAAEDAEAEAKRLRQEGFVVRFLPGGRWVRASVGAWNSEEELEGLASAARSS
jgi:selenocysteine lyase/cysteine desulfurase